MQETIVVNSPDAEERIKQLHEGLDAAIEMLAHLQEPPLTGVVTDLEEEEVRLKQEAKNAVEIWVSILADSMGCAHLLRSRFIGLPDQKYWNIGEPGGPSGPFYSIVNREGRVIAMQIPDQDIAHYIADLHNTLIRGPK